MNNAQRKMHNAKFHWLLTALCLLVISGAAQNDGSQQNLTGKPGTFAVVGGRIHTVSGGVIENGVVVIQNGKIAAVGPSGSVQIPSGAERVDARGLQVFPGMIDAGTNMGLAEITLAVAGSVDLTEVGPNNANAKAIKGIHPHSAHVNVTRVNGITTVMSFPTGGVISGQSAVINLNGSTPDEMAIIPEYALMINFPRIAGGGGPGGGGGGGFGGGGGGNQDFNELVRRRDQAVEDLKKIFRDAEAYAKAKAAYAADKSLPYVETDQRFDAMIPYVRGQKPIVFTSERERDIRAVAKFVSEMKVKGILLGGQEAWKAADVLKQNNIPVIFTHIYQNPIRDDDAYDALYTVPAKLQDAGVKFAISTGDVGAEVRDLPYQAGIAGSFGLSPENALRSVTLGAAEILGVSDRMGSIEVGKMANIVVAEGHILQPRTEIRNMFINGRLIPLTSRHTELFDAFKNRGVATPDKP